MMKIVFIIILFWLPIGGALVWSELEKKYYGVDDYGQVETEEDQPNNLEPIDMLPCDPFPGLGFPKPEC